MVRRDDGRMVFPRVRINLRGNMRKKAITVGYKNPPVASQFKPGVSGNPSGRPKRVSLRDEMLAELSETVPSGDGEATQHISQARAIIKALVRAAVDGNMRATTALLGFCAKGLDDSQDDQQGQGSAHDAALLDEFFNQQMRRRSADNTLTNDDDQPDTTNTEEN
jgi:hypothetical protein